MLILKTWFHQVMKIEVAIENIEECKRSTKVKFVIYIYMYK